MWVKISSPALTAVRNHFSIGELSRYGDIRKIRTQGKSEAVKQKGYQLSFETDIEPNQFCQKHFMENGMQRYGPKTATREDNLY